MICASSNGPPVYLVLPFTNLFTLSPVTGTEDPDRVSTDGESHCQNTLTDPYDTAVRLLFSVVARLLHNSTFLVEKRLLCHCEEYTMLLLVFSVLCLTALGSSSLHMLSLYDTASTSNIIVRLTLWFVRVYS
jgi:hypothetical protein